MNTLQFETAINPSVQIPFKPDHYQFSFYSRKGVNCDMVRRIYKGDGKNMYQIYDIAKADALRDYPESHWFACFSPQCD